MSNLRTQLEDIKRFCTPRQVEYIDAVLEHGSQAKAAKALDVNIRTVERGIASAKKKYALANVTAQSEYGEDLPAPFRLRGVSTLYNGKGEITSQWVKSEIDKDQLSEMLTEFVGQLTEEIRGAYEPPPVLQDYRGKKAKDLLTVYPMGDPHLGMYAWRGDAEENHDLDKAVADIDAAIDRLVAQAPDSRTCIIANLGDFFHADNNSAMTSRSGNILDVDTRWNHVMQVGAHLMVSIINRCLEKHEKVIVRNAIGNHDDHSSMALSLILNAFFEGTNRVHVETSPQQAWFYKHGKTLIGIHHGHSIKKDKLMGVMAVDAAQHWSETIHRYWLLGHVHHSEVREEPGVLIEYFRTLAPRDEYAQSHGYRSERDMRAIVYHKEYGEIERFTMNIRRIRDKDASIGVI